MRASHLRFCLLVAGHSVLNAILGRRSFPQPTPVIGRMLVAEIRDIPCPQAHGLLRAAAPRACSVDLRVPADVDEGDWNRSASPAAARAGPAPGPVLRWRTRRTRPPPTAATCAAAASRRSSRSRKTRRNTAAPADGPAARRLPSTPDATRSATPSSAASPSSNSSAPSRPAMTSAPSCTRAPSTSPRSGSGCATRFHELRETP
jgi:hypothetical protein